jgi:hypothetical protein
MFAITDSIWKPQISSLETTKCAQFGALFFDVGYFDSGHGNYRLGP